MGGSVCRDAAADEANPVEISDRVTPAEDSLLYSVDEEDRVYTRLENTRLKIVSFFHRRRIGDALVEKDFIRYQFNTETGELIEHTRQWREDLPDEAFPLITSEEAAEAGEGDVTSIQLMIISPESDIFPIKPTPLGPCWIVRSDFNGRQIVTVIDSTTGEKLGYGIPPPYFGLSIHGPDFEPNCDDDNPLWTNHAANAQTWFENMGYTTQKIGSATAGQISGHIQSDTTVMFYELDHGGSTSFMNRCDDHTTAGEVETWISSYASMGFAFIGSCEGLCDVGDDTFAYEFRKGSAVDSVVIGYCHMADDALCENDCWIDAIPWQSELFRWMDDGYRVGYAYERANLYVPGCADDGHNCMRIEGDENLVFGGVTYPKVERSYCGAIHDIFIPPFDYYSPFHPVMNRIYARAYHIRCDSYVPLSEQLTISANSNYPHNEVVFLNDSKLIAHGNLEVDTAGGIEILLVSASDRDKGISLKASGEMRACNGRGLKIYE